MLDHGFSQKSSFDVSTSEPVAYQIDAEELARLRDWNATTAWYPRDKIFSQIFEDQVARCGGAIALSCDGVEMTYAELDARANAVARRLREYGVVLGAMVGLCVDRSLGLFIALIAIHKAGGAYVPLDPSFPVERLHYMLSDSGAKVLVTTDACAGALQVPDGVLILDLAAHEKLDLLPTSKLDHRAGPQDAAYVIYTSGSTGWPKGVAVSHGALLNFLWSMRQSPGLSASDVVAAVTTVSFDMAALELYLPLMVGARIELVARKTATDGKALAQSLAQSQTSVLVATPAMWRMLVEAGWQGRKGFRAVSGGEPLPRDLARDILGRAEELWTLYGPTETTVGSTIERVGSGSGPISIGRPIANTQIHILDSCGETVSVGSTGELWIGGDGVAIGYHRRAELTAERFIPDRFSGEPGARLYRTGDLGYWGTDGKLYHLGRLDHQVKIRGFRVELDEIEIILRSHAAVRQAVVVAAEAQNGDQKLVAYILFRYGQDLTASDVRRYLRRQLPGYMIPSIVVSLDAMPLSPAGKVDRNALPDPFHNTICRLASHGPPSPGTEQVIAEIWQSVLLVDGVGPEDNFFEIGGDSLLTLRVAQMVEKRTGFQMDPRTLFFNNLRQVAAIVGSCTTAAGADRR